MLDLAYREEISLLRAIVSRAIRDMLGYIRFANRQHTRPDMQLKLCWVVSNLGPLIR